MQVELGALKANETWEITDLPISKNMWRRKWVYKIKKNSDGTLERYMARLVVKGYTQMEGLNCKDTFAPVFKMPTMRTGLAIAFTKGWHIIWLDVNNVFLHGTLNEEVYIQLPTRFHKSEKSQAKVCKLLKSLYGLKQASRQWLLIFNDAMLSYEFQESIIGYSRFTF